MQRETMSPVIPALTHVFNKMYLSSISSFNGVTWEGTLIFMFNAGLGTYLIHAPCLCSQRTKLILTNDHFPHHTAILTNELDRTLKGSCIKIYN